MIGPDFKGVASAFQEMPPFIKGSYDGEHFFVMDLVVPLDGTEAL